MSKVEEVMRWQLKGFIPGVEGVSKAVFKPWVVMASDFDAEHALRLEAERQVGELRGENSAIRELHCHAFEKAQDLQAKLDKAAALIRELRQKPGFFSGDMVMRLDDVIRTASTEGKDHE